MAKFSPVGVVFDENERSVFALAFSETFEKVFYGLALNDATCAIEGHVKLFAERPAPRKDYEVRLLLDGRRGFWADTVRESTDWILGTAGLKPAPVPESAFEPLYSTWYAYWQDVHADVLEKEAVRAAKLGMKTMILDDGWQKESSRCYYSKTGDWRPVASRFPDMKAHVRKVHEAGLRYMLWYSVPLIGDETDAYRRFQGKFLGGLDGDAEKHGTYVLDPRFPEVREFLVDTFVAAIRDWDFDGLKLDFIDQFVLPERDPALADGYAGRDFRSVPEATDRLMKDVLAALRKVKPDALVEFRQRYMGPAMLQYGNMMRALDCPADPSVNRRRIADLRLTSGPLAVHADMLMWSRDETSEGAAHSILSALFGVVQYSMELATLPEGHRKAIRHWIDFAEGHRETLLRGKFIPHHPELGYPLIESEGTGERITAVYAERYVVPVASGEPIIVINGSCGNGVVVEFAEKPASIEIYDTCGNRVGTAPCATGFVRVRIPMSGYARITF